MWGDDAGDADARLAPAPATSRAAGGGFAHPTMAYYVPPPYRSSSKPLSAAAPEYSPVHHHPKPRDGSSSGAAHASAAEVADGIARMAISEPDERGAYDDATVEACGDDVPPPARSFEEIDLGDALAANIRRCWYERPTPVQRFAIPIAMAGRDLMACAQTGSGKTAAFCLPIISAIAKGCSAAHREQRPPRGTRMALPLALILSPTRELACQIHVEAKKFSHQTGVKVVVVYGGAPIQKQLQDLERGVDILVATPGRLVDLIDRARLSLHTIKYLTLDEADRMLGMGFEPQIRRIVQQMDMPPPGMRLTMLFSATFPHEIQQMASDFLSNYIFLTVGRIGSSTELISQKIDYVRDSEKRNHLMDLLHAQMLNDGHAKRTLTLVFVETKRGADVLVSWLRKNGFSATCIHGDRTQFEREQALRSFKNGATPILVATDVASRGLDVPNVAHVINYDMPKDIDDYVHRIGRTGRAGKSGLATAFFSDGNRSIAKALVQLMMEANQDVPDWLLGFPADRMPSSYSYGGGRSSPSGGSRFRDRGGSSGYDSRSRSRASHSAAYDNHYGSAAGFDSGCREMPLHGISNCFGVGTEDVVASGWD